MEGYHLIAEEAARLANRLPASVIETVVARLERSDGSDWASLRGQIALAIPTPDYRGAVISLLDRWRSKAPEVTPQAVAAALVTASYIAKERREEQAVEVVWTGPDQSVIPLRRTEQAILQVLNSAQSRILLVSYAVYSIPNIQDAVVRAAKRGVTITVIVETPNKLNVQNEYSTLQALRRGRGEVLHGLLLAEGESANRWLGQARNLARQVRGRGREPAIPVQCEPDEVCL